MYAVPLPTINTKRKNDHVTKQNKNIPREGQQKSPFYINKHP